MRKSPSSITHGNAAYNTTKLKIHVVEIESLPVDSRNKLRNPSQNSEPGEPVAFCPECWNRRQRLHGPRKVRGQELRPLRRIG